VLASVKQRRTRDGRQMAQDAILSALEERIIELELELETAPREPSLEIRGTSRLAEAAGEGQEEFRQGNAIEQAST